ncbi:sulfate permease [Aspergillus pseudonomiae]|uniref:Sulfate permease n=1 Tax=Aspergillus pseudonomiae TaxID=1506151 RepID=A0A5N7CU55_9EURO|nr:sulfate permease [Aspergillus pseudonomiae]KAE8397702.1 sulfate permease [Aspergillus pseudonomiae]
MPEDTWIKVGHILTKVLGIKLAYRDPFDRGTAEAYSETEPTSIEWVKDHVPTGSQVMQYFIEILPFLKWIDRYNLQWLIGDMVAGIAAGAVVVPQSMAYTSLAELAPEYGLYSSFMGVLIYWFFTTSKDITIGPVAVMSALTGTVVLNVQSEHPELNKVDVANSLAITGGAIVAFIGFIRRGFIVDFISLTSISAFMTGSAINIIAGQTRALLGEKEKFDTKAAPYMVNINTLRHLPSTRMNAAMGLTALFMLYVIRGACNYGARKNPRKARLFFFLSTLRTAFVILFYIMISAAVNLHRRDKPAFKLLGNVPRGFTAAGVPSVNTKIISTFATELPSVVVVLLIEHIAISKSFGRVNNYVIEPSQELIAIGVTNLLGPFLGAYPGIGSFSRTAIKSKAGVRTPLAGVVTAIVVLLAIYVLPAVSFYITNSSLAAVIIHAVGDLIIPPNTVYRFWLASSLEVLIFFAGVLVTVFSTIENGVYVTISVSAALLLWRIVKARGEFLGKVMICSVIGDHLFDNDAKASLEKDPDESFRTVFLPISHHDGSNPAVDVEHPYSGVFIYRFSEGYVYPNASHETDNLVSSIFKETRRTNLKSWGSPGDRPWNNPGPRRGKKEENRTHLPCLRAIILDFSSVNNVDITSLQNLVDVRNQLDAYASPVHVQWYFANISNRWAKWTLTSTGFGYLTLKQTKRFQPWKPIFSVAELGSSGDSAAAAERQLKTSQRKADDLEQDQTGQITEPDTEARWVELVSGINRPYFHVDLTSALRGDIASIEVGPQDDKEK